MLTAEIYHPPTWLSLAVIAVALFASITASLRADRGESATTLVEGPDETPHSARTRH